MDLDYVFCGIFFGLSFGFWFEDDGGCMCVFGYFDWNYVGFCKFCIDKLWIRG